MRNITIIGGARPNFVKIAPLYFALKKEKSFSTKIIHTGQHYDFLMSKVFFEDFNLPTPDYYLGVGSLPPASQIARVVQKLEPVLKNDRPDIAIVVGDVNSTLAGAICSSKLSIPLAHVEAGLRSFDFSMPEETNRILTDALSNLLFASCKEGVINLLNEGINRKKIHFVGNIMIDSLKRYYHTAKQKEICKGFGLNKKKYALVTLHRPGNVDKRENLRFILQVLNKISRYIDVIYPVHPRSLKMMKKFGLSKSQKDKNFIFTEPLSYIKFLSLMIDSKFVITDSGGIQEETTYLKIPCLTFRNNTERNLTCYEGTNVLVGRDEKKIIINVEKIIDDRFKEGKIPEKWDGKTAGRIVRILKKYFKE